MELMLCHMKSYDAGSLHVHDNHRHNAYALQKPVKSRTMRQSGFEASISNGLWLFGLTVISAALNATTARLPEDGPPQMIKMHSWRLSPACHRVCTHLKSLQRSERGSRGITKKI